MEHGNGSGNGLPEVQILLSTFNGAFYIGELFDSLESQTFQGWQVLIRDDGSDDGTEGIIEKKVDKDPLRYVRITDSLGHLGPSLSFGQLLRYAQSPYVMFCDQDDRWLPEKIALTLSKMVSMEDLYGQEYPLLVHTDMKVVSDELSCVANSFHRYSGLNPLRGSKLTAMMIQNVVAGCTVMINRFAREMAIPVPVEAIMHDWWVGLIVAAFGRVGYLNVPTVLYRQHRQNRIGSVRYGISCGLSKGAKGLGKRLAKESFYATRRQMVRFIDQFESVLLPEQYDIVKKYVGLSEQRNLYRKLTVLRYGFWKTGIFRNLAWFLWI